MNFNIRTKLMAVLILPLLAVGGFAFSTILSNHAQWRSAIETENAVALGVTVGAAAHHLQVERGATAGYVQSNGQRFADVLPGYRASTDDAVKRAQEAFAALSGDAGAAGALNTAVHAARQGLDQLRDTRSRVDRHGIAAAEASAWFTRTIDALLKTVNTTTASITDAGASKRLGALEMLLHAKEYAGQERATMVPIFVADRIERSQYGGLNERIGKQAAFIAAFSSLAEARHWQAYREMVAGQPETAVEALRKNLHEADENFGVPPETWFSATTARIDAMLKVEQLVGGDLLAWANAQAASARTALIVAGVGGTIVIALTLALGMAIIRSITRPLASLQDTLVHVEQSGDLTLRVSATGHDEVGRTAAAFDKMMARIASVVGDTRQSAEAIAAAAQSMATAGAQVEKSSCAQSEAASAVAAAVEQTSVSISETASNARAADETTTRARTDIEKTLAAVRETATDVGELAGMIDATSGDIARLAESSRQIDGIVGTIKEIADQTNLLALNAAIEAARAGEQGRGFAVVADEVRKLAENTSKATSEISGLIGGIQVEVDAAVAQMRTANEKAGTTRDRVAASTGALDAASADTGRVTESVRSIASAVREQDVAVQQVAQRIEQIAQMTEENTAAAANAAETARHLDTLSGKLREAVSRFRV
jgi:methyl-accepting chemotaxis protein